MKDVLQCFQRLLLQARRLGAAIIHKLEDGKIPMCVALQSVTASPQLLVGASPVRSNKAAFL